MPSDAHSLTRSLWLRANQDWPHLAHGSTPLILTLPGTFTLSPHPSHSPSPSSSPQPSPSRTKQGLPQLVDKLSLACTNDCTPMDETQTDEAQMDEAQTDEAQMDEAQMDEAQMDETEIDETEEGKAASRLACLRGAENSGHDERCSAECGVGSSVARAFSPAASSSASPTTCPACSRLLGHSGPLLNGKRLDPVPSAPDRSLSPPPAAASGGTGSSPHRAASSPGLTSADLLRLVNECEAKEAAQEEAAAPPSPPSPAGAPPTADQHREGRSSCAKGAPAAAPELERSPSCASSFATADVDFPAELGDLPAELRPEPPSDGNLPAELAAELPDVHLPDAPLPNSDGGAAVAPAGDRRPLLPKLASAPLPSPTVGQPSQAKSSQGKASGDGGGASSTAALPLPDLPLPGVKREGDGPSQGES